MRKEDKRIQEAALAAKAKAVDVIDGATALAERASTKAGHVLHDAGVKVKDIGDKMLKRAE